MKSESGKYTHGRAIDAEDFRAQATGVGVSVLTSRATGERRNSRIVRHMTPEQRACVPPDEGMVQENEGLPNVEGRLPSPAQLQADEAARQAKADKLYNVSRNP
ncbi:MAG: hypothetical protein ACREVG_07680 [Burkholderiales bacterium]